MIIVFVEEDLFFAEGVKRAFAAQGIDLIHTTKADQVADLIVEHDPGAVLFDLRLSHLNGFELLQALKDDPRTQAVPLMVWSKLASQEDIQRCFSLGACEYFLKGQHAPGEVAQHLAKRFQGENGFTLPEWLMVAGAFLLVVVFAFFQINRFFDIRRDDGQLASVRASVSAIVAANQERNILTGCSIRTDIPDPLYNCKICKEESCQSVSVVPWSYTPAYERDFLDPESICSQASVARCHVSIEENGSQPLSTSAFKLRFFLVHDRDGLKGGQTHTIDENGVIE